MYERNKEWDHLEKQLQQRDQQFEITCSEAIGKTKINTVNKNKSVLNDFLALSKCLCSYTTLKISNH